jgi:hypothetical protein
MAQQVTYCKTQRYVELVERILYPNINLNQPSWLDDTDKEVLKWAFSLWYLTWIEFCTQIGLQNDFLLEERIAVMWAYNTVDINVVDLLTMLDDLNQQFIHSDPDHLLETVVHQLKVLPFPGKRRVIKLLSAAYSLAATQLRKDFPYVAYRTLLCFMGRLDLSQCVKDALEHWLEVESRIPERPVFDWKLEAALARHPMPDPNLCFVRSKLSSGAVADFPGLYGKVYQRYDQRATISVDVATEAYKGFNLYCPNGDYTKKVESLPAKLITVPKSWKTRRVIVEEPLTTAWLQSSVQLALQRATVQRWGFRCDPRDPTWNRETVWNSDWCSIDLSDASDSVQIGHVINVYPPSWRRLALKSRSPLVLMPDGSVHRLRKFAGMGNAVTFPTEMNVFCSIISTVVDAESRKEARIFGCFGDDLMVHYTVFEKIMEQLRAYGFSPNEEKSFGPGQAFRESCGVDVYDRHLATPLRLSRKFRETIVTIGSLFPVKAKLSQTEACQALVALAGDCYCSQQIILYRYLYDNLRRRGARFSNEESRVLDENSRNYRSSVLFSPSAEREYETSFGRYHEVDYYSARDTRRWNGHQRTWPISKYPEGRECSEVMLQWALCSPELPLCEPDVDLLSVPPTRWAVTRNSIQLESSLTEDDAFLKGTAYPWTFNGSYVKR